jgi:hypothetical protein
MKLATKLIGVCTALVSLSAVNASTMSDSFKKNPVYYNVQAGLAQVKPVQNTLTTWNKSLSDMTPEYVPTTSTLSSVDFGFSAGIQHSFTSSLLVQFGLGYYKTNPVTVKGDMYLAGVDPDPDYNYSFQLHNQRLMLNSRWIYQFHNCVQLFADVDLGAAQVTADKYNETVADPVNEARASSIYYSKHSTTGLAYQLGLGSAYRFKQVPNLSFNVSVAYTGLPKAELAAPTAMQKYTSQPLKTGNSNQMKVSLGLTYLFT